jgi:undecaprenyl-diphosphatase
MNQNVYIFFHNFADYSVIKTVSYVISYPLGYGLPFIIFIYFLSKHSRPLYASTLLFFSGVLSWVAAFLLKLLFHIPRPVSPNTFFDVGGYSFPSSHAAVYAVLTFTVASLKPSWTLPMVAITLLVGISRIILGVHTQVDIIGGYILGSIVGYYTVKHFKKI